MIATLLMIGAHGPDEVRPVVGVQVCVIDAAMLIAGTRNGDGSSLRFLWSPGDRNVDSRPSFLAVFSTQSALP